MLLPLIAAANTGKVFVEMFKKTMFLHRCRLHSICCVVGVGAESRELLGGKKEADIGGEHSCSNTQGNSAGLNIPAPLWRVLLGVGEELIPRVRYLCSASISIPASPPASHN